MTQTVLVYISRKNNYSFEFFLLRLAVHINGEDQQNLNRTIFKSIQFDFEGQTN